MYPAKTIPDKLFFKIGEVCDLVEVQPHVLRYWESEFPMLAPQKNRAGQRTYRRRDVELVMRIKQLLYEEGFTIAGAKKKLASELRAGAKLKIVTPEIPPEVRTAPATEAAYEAAGESAAESDSKLSPEQRKALRTLRDELQALLTMLSRDDIINEK